MFESASWFTHDGWGVQICVIPQNHCVTCCWWKQRLEPTNQKIKKGNNYYCWWNKSCTTWGVKNHVNGINYQAQLVNAGFLSDPASMEPRSFAGNFLTWSSVLLKTFCWGMIDLFPRNRGFLRVVSTRDLWSDQARGEGQYQMVQECFKSQKWEINQHFPYLDPIWMT